MQLSSGTLLHGGTYKIEKVLGQGSFGITYLAEHTSLGKKVAIKEFFMKELNSRGNDGSITGMSDGSLSHNYGQKFKKEAINLSRLEHPNIVRVTDSFDENGTYYYVMDYIDGCNLNDYLKSNSVSQKEAVEIITDVAKAVMYMHEEKHVLHLDLKPGNIMRRKNDGHIFLIDFGLSKHFSNDGQPETSTTIGLGTAGYAPVEQSNQAKNGEFRPTIDVYALGATLYKLLTGQTPPVASDLVSDDELLADSLAKYNVQGAIVGVIEKAMMPSVKKRTQSIRAFIDTLTNVDAVASTTTTSNSTDTEETAYINEVEAGEETVFVNENIEKHPDFVESTYTIKTDYKNYPIMTVHKVNSNDREAMLALGMMALRGEGVQQDFVTAHAWFLKLKNLGDDRGEKLINQWTALKGKYSSSENNNKSKTGNSNSSNGSNSGLWIFGAIIFIIVLIFSVKGCKEKREAEEKARIESIARNTEDWYGAGGGQFYCMIEGEKYFVGTYDIPDGQRTIHYSSGDTFVGTFKGGRKSQGKLTYKNGDYFDGAFLDGKFEGKGTLKRNGEYYNGTFKNGFYNGQGTVKYSNGETFSGQFVNGYPNGYGTWEGKGSDGAYLIQEGNFSERGTLHGQGKQKWPKEKRRSYSCMYEGHFNYGSRDGKGTWYYNDHTYRTVMMKNGKEVRTIEEGTWR